MVRFIKVGKVVRLNFIFVIVVVGGEIHHVVFLASLRKKYTRSYDLASDSMTLVYLFRRHFIALLGTAVEKNGNDEMKNI